MGEEKSGKLDSSQDEVEQYGRETHSNPLLGDPCDTGELCILPVDSPENPQYI